MLSGHWRARPHPARTSHSRRSHTRTSVGPQLAPATQRTSQVSPATVALWPRRHRPHRPLRARVSRQQRILGRQLVCSSRLMYHFRRARPRHGGLVSGRSGWRRVSQRRLCSSLSSVPNSHLMTQQQCRTFTPPLLAASRFLCRHSPAAHSMNGSDEPSLVPSAAPAPAGTQRPVRRRRHRWRARRHCGVRALAR